MKYPTLILILVIAIFINLSFCESLKWKRDGLVDNFQIAKKIFKNTSSLVERDDVTCECITGCTGSAPAVSYCSSEYYCCWEGFFCCGIYCCSEGQNCTDSSLGLCDDAEVTEEHTITIADFKTKNIRASSSECRTKAAENIYAYDYDTSTGKTDQITVDSIITNEAVMKKYNADHVVELQIIKKFLIGPGQKLIAYFKENSTYLEELINIMNDRDNLRFAHFKVNNAKANLIAGNNVNDQMAKNGAIEYLSTDDVSEAYSKTLKSIIALFNKIVKENGITNIDIENDFSRPSKEQYENLTGKKLSISSNSTSSSSTLQLPYLPIISSVSLSLGFLCCQRITRMLFPRLL